MKRRDYMRKKIKAPAIISSCLVLCYSFFILIARLFYPDAKESHLMHKNATAYTASNYLTEKMDLLHLPSDQTILLMGEFSLNDAYMSVYKNEFVEEDIILWNVYIPEKTCYWAAKVNNRIVQELWYNDQKIYEDQLFEYTHSWQESHVRFITPIFHPIKFYQEGFVDDSEILGYYKVQTIKR